MKIIKITTLLLVLLSLKSAATDKPQKIYKFLPSEVEVNSWHRHFDSLSDMLGCFYKPIDGVSGAAEGNGFKIFVSIRNDGTLLRYEIYDPTEPRKPESKPVGFTRIRFIDQFGVRLEHDVTTGTTEQETIGEVAVAYKDKNGNVTAERSFGLIGLKRKINAIPENAMFIEAFCNAGTDTTGKMPVKLGLIFPISDKLREITNPK